MNRQKIISLRKHRMRMNQLKMTADYADINGKACSRTLAFRKPDAETKNKMLQVISRNTNSVENMHVELLNIIIEKLLIGKFSYELEDERLLKEYPDRIFQSFIILTDKGKTKRVNMKFPGFREAIRILTGNSIDNSTSGIQMSIENLYFQDDKKTKYDNSYFDDIDIGNLVYNTNLFLMRLVNFDGFFNPLVKIEDYFLASLKDEFKDMIKD